MKRNIYHCNYQYNSLPEEKILLLLSSRKVHAEKAAHRLIDLFGNDAKIDIVYGEDCKALTSNPRVCLHIDKHPKRRLTNLPEVIKERITNNYYSTAITTVELLECEPDVDTYTAIQNIRSRYLNIFEILSKAPEGRRFVVTKNNTLIQMERFSKLYYYKFGNLEVADITSNLNYLEVDFLYQSALLAKPQAGNIIEIGSRYGLSTVILAAACKQSGQGKVYSFDINLRPEAQQSLIQYNLQDYVGAALLMKYTKRLGTARLL